MTAARPVSAPSDGERAQRDERGVHAGEPRRVAARSRRVDQPARRCVPQAPGEHRGDRRGQQSRGERIRALRQPHPLKVRGRSCTHAPCVIQRSASRSTIIIASVTTIDGRRR